MSDTPPAKRECIHCGTERPVDQELCPSCGKPWIDERVDAMQPAATAGDSVGDASDDTSPDTEDSADSDAESDEGTVAAAAAVAADSDTGTAAEEEAADAADDDTDSDEGTVAAAAAVAADSDAGAAGEETAADSATGAGAVAAGATAVGAAKLDDTGEFTFDDWTLPPEKPRSRAVWLIPLLLFVAAAAVWILVFLDDNGSSDSPSAASTTTSSSTPSEPTTTTAPDATTTTAGETTTTIPYPPPASWEAVGDPIASDDLTLKAAGIGPLDFGLTVEEAAGRLTASLGEAEAAGVDGLCPPDESYFLQWGELKAIFDGFEPGSLFVSYRYEDVGSDTELGLATLSGLELGDTVAELKQIYSAFTITFEVIDGQDHFRLLDGGELLLWGPVTSTSDAGRVAGIYSPSPCDSGA